MLSPNLGVFARALELVATMDIGLPISPAGCSVAQPGLNMVSEAGHSQQGSQCGAFSVLLEDAVKKTENAQAQPSSDVDDLMEQASPIAVDADAAGASLIDIPVEACSQMPVIQTIVSPAADKADALPESVAHTGEDIELLHFIVQGLSKEALHDDGNLGNESLSVAETQARTADSSLSPSLQPHLDPAQNGEEPAMATKQTATGVQDESPIRNDRGAPVYVVPVPLERPSSGSVPSGALPSGSLPSNHPPIPVREQQGEKIILSAVDANGNIEPLDRPSPDPRPSSIVQEQGEQEPAVPGQALPVRMAGGNGGQDPFGASLQGGGEGATFQSAAREAQESGMRGTQSTLFSDQFTPARQTQSLPQGTGTSVSTPPADQLKLTQALLAEDRMATITAARGLAQTVQVELSSHEAGPLSVRISMTDQTVHTQFTTDRSDLGAILIGRQDQLQQNLTRSGLELGQFQVHVNQEGRQEALPDRQSRRNGEALEQQLASQDQNRQSQGQERPNHRPRGVLSLFA